MSKLYILLIGILAALLPYKASAVIAVTQVTHAIKYSGEPGIPPTIDCIGSIDITAEGNAGPFSFFWSDGYESEDRSNLCAGQYTVTVTNAFGCTKVLSATVIECSEYPLEAKIINHTIVPVDPYTFLGGITVELNINSTNCIFTWRNQMGTIVGTQQKLTGVPAGIYCVTVSGTCSPTFSECFEIPNCSYTNPLISNGQLTFQTTPPCPKTPNGAIDLTVNFGAPPYQYLWSTGATTQDISGVPPKAYQVKVADGNGCFISQIVELKAEIDKIDVVRMEHFCTMESSGSLSIQAKPEGTYNYQWSNGITQTATSSTISNLAAGQYCVTVTKNGSSCSLTECWTIEDGIPESAIGLQHYKTTYGQYGCDGDDYCIGVFGLLLDFAPDNQASSTMGLYTYQWAGPNNFQSITSNPEISELCKGDYTVTVTDVRGCTGSKNFTMCCCFSDDSFDPACMDDMPGYPSWVSGGRRLDNPVIVLPSLDNNFKGSIKAKHTGLGSPVFYTWKKEGDPSFIEHTQTISNLSPGTYCLTVTDGCSYNDIVANTYNRVVQQRLTACYSLGEGMSAVTIRPTCIGGSNGRVELSLSATAPNPISVNWGSNVQMFEPIGAPKKIVIEGLAAGDYTFNVLDGKNQLFQAFATVTEVRDARYYGGPLSLTFQIDGPLIGTENQCMEAGWWPWSSNHGEIKLSWDGDDLFPNNPPLTIFWPDGPISTITFDEEGKHHINGISNYDIEEAGVYNVAIEDEGGCRIEECFSFGEEVVLATSAYIEPVLLPNTDYTINAYVGSFCRPTCGGLGCAGSNPVVGGSDHAKFDYIPNSNTAPCAGGTLRLECEDKTFYIPVESAGLEFIDITTFLDNNNNGTCDYRVGCLFESINYHIFHDQYPVYVEPSGGVTLPCDVPPTNPGEPTGIQCDGEAVVEITNDERCTGILFCYNSDGSFTTEFGQDFSTFGDYCKTPQGDCYEIRNCSYTARYYLLPITCEDDIVYPKCPQARPSDSRSSEATNTVTSKDPYLNIYPNPFTQQLHLVYDAATEGVSTVRIIDVTGRAIKTVTLASLIGYNAANVQLQDSDLDFGFYILELIRPDGTKSTRKIIKKPE